MGLINRFGRSKRHLGALDTDASLEILTRAAASLARSRTSPAQAQTAEKPKRTPKRKAAPAYDPAASRMSPVFFESLEPRLLLSADFVP
ncbi:MAG: LEPR-XLL domain-containing protein, partial [Rhodobiaceae bacterium]|nr:LEPR-XLL domain-containing protein [Rhodobiaceae bacterium]